MNNNPVIEFFKRMAHWFTSDKGKQVVSELETVAIEAEPIVEEIAALVPNRTFQQIFAAYEKYGVPFLQAESQLTDPAQQTLALRDLTVTVLRKNHADAAASTINAAVELAVVQVKSKQ